MLANVIKLFNPLNQLNEANIIYFTFLKDVSRSRRNTEKLLACVSKISQTNEKKSMSNSSLNSALIHSFVVTSLGKKGSSLQKLFRSF